MGPITRFLLSKSLFRISRESGVYAGTGFLIDERGGILTTLYVAGKDKYFKVTLPNDQTFDASLERVDGITELALLRTNGPQEYHLSIDDMDDIPHGEKVTIMGYGGNTLSFLDGTGAGTYTTDVLSPQKLAIKVDSPPRGLTGAPACNEKGSAIGILVGYLPQSACALAISGSSILRFLKACRVGDTH